MFSFGSNKEYKNDCWENHIAMKEIKNKFIMNLVGTGKQICYITLGVLYTFYFFCVIGKGMAFL